MGTILQALNKPVDAFKAKNRWVAWGLVALTILVNTVLEPLLRLWNSPQNYKFNLPDALLTIALSVATYLIICTVFWIVCRCFGSKTPFGDHVQIWGLTYFPTLLCSAVVVFTEAYFYIFWNSVVWGMVFNILFVGILLWKTILYVIYLREVAGLKRGKSIGAFILIGIFIILLALANGYVGIKTPVL
jgi:Yip1 domain.